MTLSKAYPRDLIGYGSNPPQANWPGRARVAVQFVLNYEEGGENCVLHGDAGSEQFLSELFNAASYPERHLSMEGIYEYGSRVGVWRFLREFERRGLPMTIFGVSMALERHPELTAAFRELGHEIACHGWRWIHYQNVPEEIEREHMRIGMEIIERLTGERALGWYTGRDSPNTRRLVADYGGFLYDSDYYGDDLPFWTAVQKTDGETVPHLVVPYTLDTNDMRFALPQGFSHGDEFFEYLRDAFDVMYAEGEERPAMMSIGMHCRLLGRPGRFRALQRFLDHIEKHDRVGCAAASMSRGTGSNTTPTTLNKPSTQAGRSYPTPAPRPQRRTPMASHTPGAPVFAPPAELPDWALRSVDLANPRLGAKALAASDDFFAEVARMLNPEPAQFVPGKFDTNGKWMDGWESRRKRVAGQDWALVKLGVKGVIRGFDVDTSHFTGNYPRPSPSRPAWPRPMTWRRSRPRPGPRSSPLPPWAPTATTSSSAPAPRPGPTCA